MTHFIFIGADVHKRTISLASFDRENNKIYAEVKIPTDLEEVLRYLKERKKEFKDQDVVFKIGYESGCLGTWLAEDLITAGYDCVVMAASTIAKSSVQDKKKNDMSDARMIARALAWNQYAPVHLLDREDMQVREFVRMRQDKVNEFKRAKQQLGSFLLRHRLEYTDGKSAWTIRFKNWLRTLKLEGLDGEILSERIAQAERLEEDLERMNKRVKELSETERYKENVGNITCLKGIKELGAMTILSECGDLSRFDNAPQFASYIGLVPSDHSSGGKSIHGGLTKAGNKAVRTLLIEAAQCIVRGTVGYKSKALKQRQADRNPLLIMYCDRAIERIQKKFRKMQMRSISYNKSIAACARELACFIWGILTGNIYTREEKLAARNDGYDPKTGEVYA